MPNKRFLELAKRLGNKELPKEKTKKEIEKETPKIPKVEICDAEESFILTYNDFGNEIIGKSNELFLGTKAEIALGTASEEVQNMYALKRMALVTTIYNDKQLQSYGFFPITPLQSEQLLKDGKLPKPTEYWEDLGLILYDVSKKGYNPKEARALKESLQKYRIDLGLSKSDLEERLLIINAGAEKDSKMPHGAKPIILPGLTQVYVHPVLEKTGENHNFEFGLENGLPSVSELGNGNRTLHMPSVNKNLGLRVLYRDWGLVLFTRIVVLVNSYSGGRVNFSRRVKKI